MAKRGGKYASVVGKLPKLSMVEPERKDIVEAVRAEVLASAGSFEYDKELAQCGFKDESAEAIAASLQREAQNDVPRLVSLINDCVKRILLFEKRSTAGKPWASEFARVYAELRDVADKFDAWQSSINLLVEVYQQLMTDQFEVEGITGLKLDNGQLISTWQEPYAQVVDHEAFRQWCIKQGLERKMQLPWQTTNALTKKRLLAGESEPDGVTCWAKTRVRLGGE